MSDVIHVATRKGLFRIARRPSGWAVERVSFLGDPVTMALEDARDGTLYAALNLGHFGVKLRRSEDQGRTWTEVSAPSFPLARDTAVVAPSPQPSPPASAGGEGARGPTGDSALAGGEGAGAASGDGAEEAPSVHQVWALAAGGPSEPGVLWAGTIPAALFRSADRGESWQLVRALWERPERKEWGGGGYDQPGLHSICVDPSDPRRLHCAISSGGVWFTPDGGERWEPRSAGMYAEYMPPERREEPNVQDPHRTVQCPSAPAVLWTQHHNGVFRSVDGAARWTEVTAIRPSKFGFAVAVHPEDADTAWFVPGVKDECRVPVDGRLVVARTEDGGESFEVLREGLPQENAYDLVYRHALDVDDTGERLAMGSTTGNLWVSESGGESWRLVSGHLPPIYQVAFGR